MLSAAPPLILASKAARWRPRGKGCLAQSNHFGPAIPVLVVRANVAFTQHLDVTEKLSAGHNLYFNM
jgi:hypothetical protein